MNFRAATDLLGVKLGEVGEYLGKKEPTLLAYRQGVRHPPPDVLLRLAAFMRDHAERLLSAADEVEARAQLTREKRMEFTSDKARERAEDRLRDQEEERARDR